MKEIRLHGRGGQGALTASQVLLDAFIQEGKCGQAFPFFTFERRQAPVLAFVRVDDCPIREKTQIYEPDCVLVLDATLRNAVDVFAGLKGDAIAVLNDNRPVERLKLPSMVKKVGIVDASKIAIEIFGTPITNSAMLGSFAATTAWVSLEATTEAMRRAFEDAPLAEKNIRAARRGFQETRIVQLGDI